MQTRSGIAALVIAALLALPPAALAKEHGRGNGHSDKHSSKSVRSGDGRHGGGQGNRSSWSRGGGSQERRWSRNVENSRERISRNSGGSRERTWSRDERRSREPIWSPSRGGSSERTWRSDRQRAYRTPSPGRVERRDRDVVRRIARGDVQRRYSPRGDESRRYRSDGRTYSRSRDDYSTRYKPSGPIVGHDGGARVHHARRHYYVGDFYRPRYVARSGFFIGLSFGAFPSYDYYRYFDPYCGLYFHGLESYYGHCHGYDHPSAILVIDYRSHAPIATCIYDDGDWVVDDCASGEGDYVYEDEYYEEQ